MANIISSSNMGLPVPVVGVDTGPDWALNIDSCLILIDSHDHSAGKGVPITPSGININADLTFGGNNAFNLRSTRFSPQVSALSLPADIGCLYEVGDDLYYNDGAGNQIRITQSGGVVGSPGSISGLSSPASATYVSANETFVWQSAANTPANLDAASLILRNLTANSKGLTLSPPNAMGADYDITMPSLPASQKIMTLDNSGNMAAPYVVDNSTIEVSSNTIQVKAQGVGTVQLTDSGVTPVKIGPSGWQGSGSSGSFSTSSGTSVDITNQLITITTYQSNPVKIALAPAFGSPGLISIIGSGTLEAVFKLIRDVATTPVTVGFVTVGAVGPLSLTSFIASPSSVEFYDYTQTPGSHTYTLQVASGGGTVLVQNCILLGFL